ncbi:hypothetical protein CEUSTIGMA_g12133.t1 [Chlamydomonas eustigma]|uniref:GINS subunit domain-containing protein n=1 Tax=Chlamydomonas eustigma TaxID=1157962 RepID=A0A250XNP4_9CHLO|nr:hypothetical protein CEUSTIGMA_g12133.t1 [Chlamydomonas eustigma]|eukprot:GAX84711.1 hypothetical protein CEUSTIGMA_g12133.t1 [Chlamydomonas eustigma]
MLNLCHPHELLAEESTIQTVFNYGAVGIAKGLDLGSTKADVEVKGRICAPLWLLPDLYKRNMISFEMPEVYNDRYRRKFNAGAECLSLKNKAPFFYEVGMKCNSMLQDVELSNFLSRTFQRRYQDLISKGLNTMSGEEVLELHCKLSVEEQQLFEGGRASITACERWVQRNYSNYLPKDTRKKRSAVSETAGAQDDSKQRRS